MTDPERFELQENIIVKDIDGKELVLRKGKFLLGYREDTS